MNFWWSTSPRNGNFGDILTPFILNHYGIAHRWSTISRCDAISIGSIVRFAPDGVDVLGSGAIDSSDQINPRAIYRWVRGPLTRQMVLCAGGDCPEIYGDPAMLLPRVFKRNTEPKHEVGVFAHYVDLEHCGKYPFVINPLEPVQTVLHKLWSCERIVSSSLHGIIAAHAYGIPAAWVKFSDKLTGDDIKFHDHAMSVGMVEMPLSTVDNPEYTLANYNGDQISGILIDYRNKSLRT
jgi:hypothetical protein